MMALLGEADQQASEPTPQLVINLQRSTLGHIKLRRIITNCNVHSALWMVKSTPTEPALRLIQVNSRIKARERRRHALPPRLLFSCHLVIILLHLLTVRPGIEARNGRRLCRRPDYRVTKSSKALRCRRSTRSRVGVVCSQRLHSEKSDYRSWTCPRFRHFHL
jgi:hypothetical protein